MTNSSVDALSDRSVVLALQELTEALPTCAEPPTLAETPTGAHVIRSEADARLAVARLLQIAGSPDVDPATILASEKAALAAARRLLDLAVSDPDTSAAAREIVADPPQDDQMSVELVVTAAVVLGALIGWLQTKVTLTLKRSEGKTDVELSINKAAADPELLRNVANVVSALVSPQPPAPPS